MRESDVEAYLVKRVKAMGGEVRKVKWIGRRGAPDRLVMLPARMLRKWGGKTLGPGVICCATDVTRPAGGTWVELKRPGGLATFPKDAHERAQQREHKRMEAMGQRVVVIDSLEGVEALLS